MVGNSSCPFRLNKLRDCPLGAAFNSKQHLFRVFLHFFFFDDKCSQTPKKPCPCVLRKKFIYGHYQLRYVFKMSEFWYSQTSKLYYSHQFLSQNKIFYTKMCVVLYVAKVIISVSQVNLDCFELHKMRISAAPSRKIWNYAMLKQGINYRS